MLLLLYIHIVFSTGASDGSTASEYKGTMSSPFSKERALLSFNSIEMELRQKSKALSNAEEKAKVYINDHLWDRWEKKKEY